MGTHHKHTFLNGLTGQTLAGKPRFQSQLCSHRIVISASDLLALAFPVPVLSVTSLFTPSLTSTSARQLGVDISYLGEILEDLGHPLSADLARSGWHNPKNQTAL